MLPISPTAPRDASAAAVVASALLELSTLEDDKERADKYYKLAEKMLRNLSTKKYQSRDKNPAFLLHSTGHYPADDEIDASIIYADYYYIEALMRWKKIRAGQSLSEANKFMHPGILHTKESLERMKYYVDHRIEPAYSSYRLLEADSCALSTYQMQGPFEVIARLGVNKHTKRPSEDDHKAAYLNALMWTLTGDEAHARKSIEILNAYSAMLKLIGPNDNDDPLCASLQGSMLANAAELIKHTYSKSHSGGDCRLGEDVANGIHSCIGHLLQGETIYKRQLGGLLLPKHIWPLVFSWKMRLSTIRQFTSITTGTTTERLRIISARTDSVKRAVATKTT